MDKLIFDNKKNTELAQYNIKNRIVKLYEKYLNQTISRKEFDELFFLIKNDENKPIVESLINDSILERHSVFLSKEYAEEPKSSPQPKVKRKFYLWASAAAAAVLILVSLVLFFIPGPVNYVVHTTGFQETKTVELPDGSSVLMNASSELKWEEGFHDDEERIVFFSGEGFFDVSHQVGKKFIVKTPDVDVNVLGTKFNLESRSAFTNVFLKEGKVLLQANELEDIAMEPGDLVKYDQKEKTVEKLLDQSEEVSTSWTNGIFTFVDNTGWQILEKMTAIYGKEFIVEDSSGLDEVIVIHGLPYTDWDFTREALELMLQKKLMESISNKIIVGEE